MNIEIPTYLLMDASEAFHRAAGSLKGDAESYRRDAQRPPRYLDPEDRPTIARRYTSLAADCERRAAHLHELANLLHDAAEPSRRAPTDRAEVA